jgi:hypothetical protein
MGYSSTIFRQILNLLPQDAFNRHVEEQGANRYSKHFKCWSQLIANLYAQASGKKSLRDIETGLRINYPNWHHLGIKGISRSQLSYVNQRRDWRLFENLFYQTYHRLRGAFGSRFRFKNPVKILDSTLIKLCLSSFPWATFRQNKGALKLHFLLDQRSQIPDVVVLSEGHKHDVAVARSHEWNLSPDSILLTDRAYIDYKWLHSLHCRRVLFVCRAKSNIHYEDLGQHRPSVDEDVLDDFQILLKSSASFMKYPDRLRLVVYYDRKNKKELSFLTNIMNLPATAIANLYKSRWDIEEFFRWIKQNLKIKTFLGTSENAVLIQIWSAMIYYLLLNYIKYQAKYSFDLLHLTRVLKETLFRNLNLIELLRLRLPIARAPDNPTQQRLLFDLSQLY